MNKLKKMIAAIVACISVAALAIGFAACDGGPKGPVTLEKTKISDCKLEYNWGEVFSGENLAYEITYPDGTKEYGMAKRMKRNIHSLISLPLQWSIPTQQTPLFL